MSDVRDHNLNRWGFVDDSGTLITIASSNVSIDELNSILGTINIVPNDDNYVLMVNGREAGVISITSQLKLKNVVYNPDTQSIEFTFESDEGEKKVSVDVHELVDVYTAGQGLGVDKNQFFIKIDPSSEKYLSVSENGIKISGLDTLLKNLNETLANFGQETAKAFDQINNVLETSINTINGGIDNEIRPAIAKNADDISAINEALLNKVEYTDVATSENPGRKAIVLKNHDTILGNTKNGTSVNIAMVSKWDKVDLGSAQVSINLNGKDERPTYNDEKEIALLEDVQNIDLSIYATKEEFDAEVVARSEADTDLQNNLNTEAEARIAKDAEIDEALEKKVEYTDVANDENPNRKAIVLKNHDAILGYDTNGTAYNLAMVSKWNKADFGSASLSINLNGKDERPTYNDEKEIALLEDVQGLGATIVLEKTNDLQYTLKVGDAIVGTIDIPKDQFVKSVSYNEESKTIDFVFETTDGEQTVAVNVSNLVDTYTAGNGISLASNEFSLKIDATTQQYIEVSAEGLKIVNIDEKLAEKVGLVDIATEENPNRKAIVLKNHDTILGTTTEGTTRNLIMMSKWNKVDVGTASNELNLNGSAEHPTYNDEKELAFVDEIPSVEGLASEEWVNAQGFLKEHQDISHLAEKADLDAEIEARGAADTQLQADLESEAEARKIADDEIKLELEDKVEYTDISDGENPNRKTIQLNNHDTISGLDTSGVGYNLAMVSKWNKADFGSASLPINLNGSEERPTYNDDEEIALMKDIEEIKLPIEFNFPIRTLQDKVYTKEEIFAWFGVADAAELKGLIVREGQFYLRYGIQLSGNPYYYRMPIQYIAFESANQIKMVVIGLDTTNDMPTKYEIILNLDGTIAEGNSNIKVTSNDLAFATDMPSLDGYATEEWVNTQGFLKEHQDISNLATKDEVDAAIATKAEQADVDEIKADLEQFKAPYEINLNALNSAGDADSEAISTAIGGIDNLRAVISENRSIIGDINNGTVPVSIRILGNITTVYYVLDSLAGYTLNEINIQNTSGTLAKNSVTHSVMSEEMVVDNLTSNESTLPLSAKQGKVLDEKIQKKGMYYQGVKVDTQKLFALTKESSESDIKAALQLETSSGSYTLPTAEILDDCLGKGYQLLSNWMPVSVAWNGAAYVLYIVGQNYMMQPTGLYTVSIKITDGVYSVFQAAKFEEFANIDDLNKSLAEYQKIDVLTYDDDWNSAKAKVANGVKTIVDNDGLQWTITLVKEEPINETNTLKVIASKLRSPYSDDIDTPYGFTFAQFTLKEGAIANSWSKVTSNGEFISEYTVNNLIDEKLITVNNAITLLNDKVSILENKYNMILEENSESVADFVGGDTINDTTKSYSVSNANIESNSTINAKNIVLNDSTLSNNARLKVNSNNIEVNNLNISGNFPQENGNSVISLNDAGYVVFKDMTFNSNNVYNGVEIGLNSEKLPKNILFENCKFKGTFSNNAILVFGTQNDATITLSNCTFDKLSNALRLSNKSNASGVTVNIINCSVNQWEETNKEYGGFLICEDYTSDASSVDSNNLFGNGKITVNFMNLTYKGEKVIYSNASRCCGTKDENQVVYVYADNVGFVNYSEDKYPIVTFK